MRTKKVEKNTAAKKTVEKKAVAAVKPVETTVATAPVSEAKAEVKAEEPAKETAAAAKPVAVAKKPAKAVAAKKTAAKTTAKKETAKKETAPKAAKTTRAAKAVSQKIVLQVKGNELDMESIVNRVKEAYVAEGHTASSIKNVAVYIKPEENMIYYVIDDYASGISLC